MLIALYNDSIQKVNYKNYKLDETANLLQLQLIEHFIKLSLEHDLKIIVSGLWGVIFKYKKIYRSPTDVDILINKNDIFKWMSLLKDQCDYLYNDDPIKYFQKLISGQNQMQPLFYKEFNTKIDLVIISDIEEECKKKDVIDINFNNFTVYFFDPLGIKSGFNRAKDRDDLYIYLNKN